MKPTEKVHITPRIKKLLLEARDMKRKNDMLATSIPILKLFDEGLNPKTISKACEKLGFEISPPHVYNYKKLAEMPAKAQAILRTKSDYITPTKVLEFMYKDMEPKELIAKMEAEVLANEKAEATKQAKNQTSNKMIEDATNKIRAIIQKATGRKPHSNPVEDFISQFVPSRRHTARA